MDEMAIGVCYTHSFPDSLKLEKKKKNNPDSADLLRVDSLESDSFLQLVGYVLLAWMMTSSK